MGNLTKNEIITLKYLAEGKKRGEALEGLTQAQFYAALKSLKNKGMVFAQFIEGGEVYASQINTEGLAALDDLKDEEARKLRVILRNFDITQNQYKLLCHIKEIGHDENIFEVPWNTYKDEIWLPIFQKGYLRSKSGSDKKYLVLTDKGKELLQEIEDNLYGDGQGDLWQPVSAGKQLVPTAPVEQPKKTKASDVYVAKGCLSHVIKIIQAMCDLNYFVDVNGNKATNKSVMDYFSEAFNARQLQNYSPNLNRASQAASEETFLKPFYDMEDKAKEYYKKHKQAQN